MKDKIINVLKKYDVNKDIIRAVDEVPDNTAAWMPKGRDWHSCSNCNWGSLEKFNYCPNCGFEMVNSKDYERRKNWLKR